MICTSSSQPKETQDWTERYAACAADISRSAAQAPLTLTGFSACVDAVYTVDACMLDTLTHVASRDHTGLETAFARAVLERGPAEERVVAGVLVPGFNVAPNNQLGDGVDVNDVPYLPYFPYVALPHNPFAPHHNEPHGAGAKADRKTPSLVAYQAGLRAGLPLATWSPYVAAGAGAVTFLSNTDADRIPQLGNSQTMTAGLTLDIPRAVRQYLDSGGVLRRAMLGLEPVDVNLNRSLLSVYDGTPMQASLGYQFALGGIGKFRSLGSDLAQGLRVERQLLIMRGWLRQRLPEVFVADGAEQDKTDRLIGAQRDNGIHQPR